MPSLETLQKRIPSADTVAGRCICFHEGKHYDLGAYVGDGQVILEGEGRKLIEELDARDAAAAEEAAQKKGGSKKAAKSDLDDVTI
jgi:hypothetical protein